MFQIFQRTSNHSAIIIDNRFWMQQSYDKPCRRKSRYIYSGKYRKCSQSALNFSLICVEHLWRLFFSIIMQIWFKVFLITTSQFFITVSSILDRWLTYIADKKYAICLKRINIKDIFRKKFKKIVLFLGSWNIFNI